MSGKSVKARILAFDQGAHVELSIDEMEALDDVKFYPSTLGLQGIVEGRMVYCSGKRKVE